MRRFFSCGAADSVLVVAPEVLVVRPLSPSVVVKALEAIGDFSDDVDENATLLKLQGGVTSPAFCAEFIKAGGMDALARALLATGAADGLLLCMRSLASTNAGLAAVLGSATAVASLSSSFYSRPGGRRVVLEILTAALSLGGFKAVWDGWLSAAAAVGGQSAAGCVALAVPHVRV